MTDPVWWCQAVVYQIYPRSFADSNGDGVGDLPGATSRVGYLADLGVDAVWLNPFYPSALADGGYDVDDYRDVDPRLGTLADFDAMVGALHDAGVKVIVDIVPNHTSNRHAWFVAALAAAPGSPERQRYVFRDGKGPDVAEPPNDWLSVFGGPAWERVSDGQWYLHMFAPEQPDLNWESPEVREDFLHTLRFWSGRGVDGFRVDVAHALVKDLSEPYLSVGPPGEWQDMMAAGTHPWWDRDGVHDVYVEWRRVLDEYDPPRMAVAEAGVPRFKRPRYASADGLGQAFNFDLLHAPWDAEKFRTSISENLALAEEAGTPSTWVLSTHDVVRHASRYGLSPQGLATEERWLLGNGTEPRLDGELGLRRARAATLLLLALPGSVYLYQGEELGLHEVADLPAEVLQDPTWRRSTHTVKGRDGCRVPLPWTADGSSFGFGSGSAHLPQPDWFGPVSVASQAAEPASTLNMYRTALGFRRTLQRSERWSLLDSGPSVVHLLRPGGWHSVTNLGSVPVTMPVRGELLVTSGWLPDGLLAADTTAWLRT
ncbi:MAG: glycoside hydrolase family 13 protein [Marmoricola sp.]